jgi:phytoene dehydrogenase-like protein
VWPFARAGSLRRLLEAEVRTPRLRQFIGHFARLLGLEPERAPAVALVIPHLLVHVGIWYPRGGMTALAASLARLAEERGAMLRPTEPVQRLEIAGGRVRCVHTAAGPIPADACVSAAGMGATARWMGGGALARRTARLRPADTARVAWWVVEGRPALPMHHAFHFTADPAEEPVYVNLPSVTDPDLAPGGTCIVYALRHAPLETPVPDDFADGLRHAVQSAGQWPDGPVRAQGVSADPGGCYGFAIGAGILSGRHPSQRLPAVANLILAGKTVFPGPGVANVIRSGLRAADLAEAAATGASR